MPSEARRVAFMLVSTKENKIAIGADQWLSDFGTSGQNMSKNREFKSTRHVIGPEDTTMMTTHRVKQLTHSVGNGVSRAGSAPGSAVVLSLGVGRKEPGIPSWIDLGQHQGHSSLPPLTPERLVDPTTPHKITFCCWCQIFQSFWQ